MRVRAVAPWIVVLLVVALIAAAGCGGSSSSGSSASPAAVAAGVSADQVVKDSEAKMAQVTSASFVADVKVGVQGDTSKMTDPTAQALLGSGITVRAEGKSSNDPTAVDMTISLGISGQTLELGMMTQGTESWVQYQDKWYKVDAKSSKSLDQQAQIGAAPTEQLKSLGLDPGTWGTTYSMVGIEDLNGTQVYHVKATADPQKLADALLKASQDPSLAKKLGGQAQLKQLEQSLTQNKQQTEELGKSLKQATVDYWIGVDDGLMYKAQFAAAMDTTGQKDMSGVDGITMSMTMSMSDFDEPVTVTPPANALPLDKLMEQMFGMAGGLSY
jgi:hypothetical protein